MDEDTLQQLVCDIADMDPDNTMLPVGFRQRDQTTKDPTGQSPWKFKKILYEILKLKQILENSRKS